MFPKNFQINIPNVARLILNVQYTVQQDGAVMTQGAGLYLSLLKPRGENAIGAEVMLNPTYSAVQLVNPTLQPLRGRPRIRLADHRGVSVNW